MHKNKTYFSFLGIVVCLMFVATIFQGCEPLRKKFTRQKKEEAEMEEEPVLDPIDYPAKAYDPKADYKYRFSLFHVWEKEFVSGVDDLVSEKRLKYFAENVIIQLVEMDKLVTEEKRADIQKCLKGYKEISKTLDLPSELFNTRDLKRQAENLAKPILLNYTFRKMENNIKTEKP